MQIRSVLVVCLLAGPAFAHSQMRSPAARTTSQKIGPCGADGSTRGDIVTTFAPGETITVEWDETVDHPGHFRLALDMDGDDDFPNPSTPDDNFPTTMVEPIMDHAGGGHYTQELTLPTETCENCTLQLVQVMTTAIPYNSFYYQCADIRIAEGGGSGGSGGSGSGSDVPPVDDGGCSAGSGSASWLAVAGLGAMLAFRRRPAPRR